MKARLTIFALFVPLVLGSLNLAWSQEVKPGAPPATERYRIGLNDVLEIRVYNRPQLSRDAVRVEGNGMIRMPLIETEIRAACSTEGELAKEISTRYAKYYRNLPVD